MKKTYMNYLLPCKTTPKHSGLEPPPFVIAHQSVGQLGSPAELGQAWLALADLSRLSHAFVVSWQVSWPQMLA